MGRGTFRSTSSRSRLYYRQSDDVLTFFNQPKPRRNWLTAREDHPALIENRKVENTDFVAPQQTLLSDVQIPKISHEPDSDETSSSYIEPQQPPELDAAVDVDEHTDDQLAELVEVYERDEVVGVMDWWLGRVQEVSSVPWAAGEWEGSSLLLDTASRLDPLHNFDWENCRTHCGRVFRLRSGGRNSQGRLHGKVEVVFSSGEEVSGTFRQGRRHGHCQVTSPGLGLRSLTGDWSNNSLCGLATCLYTDGRRAEGGVRDGAWHGLHRRFHPTGELAVYGTCRNGKLVGRCWKFYPGGGALYGEVTGPDELISGPDTVYLYPDYLTGIKKLVAGVRVRVTKATLTKGNFLHLDFASYKNDSHVFRYQESTSHHMAENPLVPDIYESKTVSCKKSRVGDGEGLFLKRPVKAGTVVAFYNGIRLAGLEPDGVAWEDRGYRIMLREDSRMDIPEDMRLTSQYRATLAHKVQHSFEPNCEFWEATHPVFGYIPCVRALSDLDGGLEVTVHYNYMLDDCPQWYSDLWESGINYTEAKLKRSRR